jgi:hypothetical protein
MERTHAHTDKRTREHPNHTPTNNAVVKSTRLSVPPNAILYFYATHMHGPGSYTRKPKLCGGRLQFFYIYIITILQKYMVRHKFCKNIHLQSWLWRQGHNTVTHGGRSRQEWALSVAQTWRRTPWREEPSAVGHSVRS